MRAGLMRRRVQIQARSDDVDSPNTWRDGHSGAAVLWTTVATVWARIKPVTGRELLDGNRKVAEVDYEVEIRYRAYPQITEKHRLIYIEDADASPDITRILNIEACKPERQQSRILLECIEGSNNG